MLDYENQIFLDILNEDGLVITAKGLGLENVFLNLLKVYCDPGNLVLILGTTAHEERYYVSRLEKEGVFPLPRVITSESGTSAERMNVYLQGGVLFVSPRILVVDLLKDRLPIAHVTGIMVYRAQSIVKSCQEAFAVRLYRQKNKTGFVKAFSNSAQAFTAGFAQVGRIMRMLFLKQIFLWPRFQAIVQSCLGSFKPEVIEMHVQPTSAMTRIQNAILDLMSFTVKELKRINPSMDFDELTVENAIAKSFHKILQLQLDPIWHQLSSKTKVLVADLKIFRVFLNYLVRYDSVTFNAFVSSFRSQSYAVNSSGWLLLESANIMFTVAGQRVTGQPRKAAKAQDKAGATTKGKRRVLQDEEEAEEASVDPEEEARAARAKKLSKLSLSQRGGAGSQRRAVLESLKKAVTPPKVKRRPVEGGDLDSDPDADLDGEPDKTEECKQAVDPEPSPKWMVLKEILAEIKETLKAAHEDALVREKVLILVQDKRTAKQLQDFLVHGAQEMLLTLYEKSREKKVTYIPGRSYGEPNAKSPTKLFERYRSCNTDNEGLAVELSTQMMSKHDRVEEGTPEKEGGGEVGTPEKKGGEEVGTPEKKRGGEEGSGGDVPTSPTKGEEEYRDVYVLSQCKRGAGKSRKDGEEESYEVVANETCQLDDSIGFMETLDLAFQSPLLIIQTFKTNGDPLSMPQALEELRPRFIVMYDVDMSAIRRIEVYQALNPSVQVRVYFVVFGGSVEEQAYLTALRREKEAFDFLIKEKATMVIPEDQDGKSDHCEALSRDASKPNETVNTRRGGAYEEPATKRRSTIIVDMREFNSELPAMIHRRGIDVEPITLQIGDYILSPEICVERKSVSDLIGSLNHGRLYNQAKAMTRYYASPILLIEFDQNKPMTLQGNYYISNDMSSNDVSSKLILLTLHFPQLKIVWSPSPYATAQLFEELKQVREEPDAVKAAEVGADLEQDLDIAEKYNPAIHDLVARLPGVTAKNVHALLNAGGSLDRLAGLTKEELTKMLENSHEAESLHDAFHGKFKPVDTTEVTSRRGGGRWRGKGGRGFKR